MDTDRLIDTAEPAHVVTERTVIRDEEGRLICPRCLTPWPCPVAIQQATAWWAERVRRA